MSKPNRHKVPEREPTLQKIYEKSAKGNSYNLKSNPMQMRMVFDPKLNVPTHEIRTKESNTQKPLLVSDSNLRNMVSDSKLNVPTHEVIVNNVPTQKPLLIDRRSTPHRYLNSFLHPSKKQVSKIRNYNQLLEYLALPNNQKLDPREFLQIHPNDLGKEVFKDDFFEEVQDYNNRKNLRIAAMKMKNLKKLKDPTQSLTRRKVLEKYNKRGGKKTRKGHKGTRKGKMKKRSRSRKFIPKHY